MADTPATGAGAGAGERIGAAVLFLAVAFLQIALIARHDPWSDELQALVIAREIHDLASLRAQFRTEGHPPLWHLLLKAALAVHDSVATLQVVQASVAIASLALIVFRAPFPLFTRAVIAFGYFVLVEHGMFARSYGLGMLLVLGYAALGMSRWRFLPLALMPAVATPFFVLSAGFAAVEMWRRREASDVPASGLALWAAVAAASLPFMLPDRGMSGGLVARFLEDGALLRAQRTLFGFWATVAPLNPPDFPLVWETRLVVGPLAWIGGLVPLAVTLAVFRRSIWLVPPLLLIAFLAFMSFFVHLMAGRHLGLVPLALVACEWRRRGEGSDVHPALRLWLIALAVCGLVAAFHHLRTPFTPARDMIAWIDREGLRNATFVSFPDYLFAPDIAAWLRRPAVGLTSGCARMAATWDYDHLVMPRRDHARRVLAEVASGGGRAFLIVEPETLARLGRPEDFGLAEVARFDRGMIYNRVILRIDAPPVPGPPAPRPCAS